MKKDDVVSSLFWIAFGAVFCAIAWQYGLVGGPGVPGPGCLPFIVGVALISMSLTILIPAAAGMRKDAAEKEPFFPERSSWRKLAVALAGLIAYGVLLEPLGYILTSFLFMVFVLRWIEPQKWTTVIIFAGLSAALTYALFTGLKVELPSGVFRL
ncbi:MAG TPA: tripartite tricarboxylate transporter TctB family protein [Thermodesulfobacteriota bacterium]|nr:tripartite tricarboxylate transporter TctB family protein [Thermodesulfobacteriota bacterium]